MAKRRQNLGRAYLVSKLRERGFSRRQSVQIINTILDGMIGALKRDREVEFPFGKLKRVRRYFSDYWDFVDDWPANRAPYTVEWQLDEAGDRELHPQQCKGVPERPRRTRERGK